MRDEHPKKTTRSEHVYANIIYTKKELKKSTLYTIICPKEYIYMSIAVIIHPKVKNDAKIS